MKMRSLLFIIVLSVCSMVSHISNAAGIHERIYVQTDKQLYLAGELLWLKLYVTNEEGQPLSFSKVGYVELINENSSPVQIILDLQDGVGKGCIELPIDLTSGYYQLVAYTKYMQNEGERVFFEKNIAIVNTFKNDDTILSDSTLQVENTTFISRNVAISTDNSFYQTRSAGEITLTNLPVNVHSLGISVAGKEKYSEMSCFDITNWKKGLSMETAKDFITQISPEYEGHIVNGKLISLEGNQFINPNHVFPLISFPGNQIRLFSADIDKDANVSFYTTDIGGVEEAVTSIYNISNAEKYRIDIQSPFFQHEERALPSIVMNPQWRGDLLERSIGLQIFHTYMLDSLNLFEPSKNFFRWSPTRSYLLDEYTRFTTMEEVIIEFVLGVRFRKINNQRFLSVINEENTAYATGNTLALLDGIPIVDHEFIFQYDPLLVERIDLYKGQYTFGNNLFEGIIHFTTYNNNYPGLRTDESTQIFDYKGTQLNRQFYVPSIENRNIPDYRHTLLWEPDIRPLGSESIKVPFVTSDLKGDFQIHVEGITTDGQVISGAATFRVD